MSTTAPEPEADVLRRALLAIREMRSRLDAAEQTSREPIAIVGMACRFPGGATSPDAFWRLLRDGVDAVREVPADRWRIDEYYDADPDAPGKMYTRSGGFLDDIAAFDSQFFGISPREAVSMDPQQRLLLEVCWEALEHAGQAPDRLSGSRTGVFVGVTTNDYMELRAGDPSDLTYAIPGNLNNFAAGRVSYLLGLQGPCMAVDAACASSLVTVHLACQSLRTRECDAALAAGVNAIISPRGMILLSRMRALSPDGRCKAFDASADGMGRGEGCGVLVLKRLKDAVAAGDNVLAIVRGSAVRQDGRTSGLTVPNRFAQEALIREALDVASLSAGDVDYVEAHGTGTPLGDPIEMEALSATYGAGRAAGSPVLVGSVKTNIGHLESAAGVAGLIKTILALQHETIPPHLHFDTPSAAIDWDRIACRVPTSATPWRRSARLRRAGVSAFGLSGIIAHVLLEEPPPRHTDAPAVPRSVHVLALSAKSETALSTLAAGYETLFDDAACPTAAVTRTANTGRAHFAHRLAVVATTSGGFRQALATLRRGESAPGLHRHAPPRLSPPRIGFLFTGQGSQYAGMGRQFFRSSGVFRAALEQCAALLRPHLPEPLLDVMFADDETRALLLDQTQYTQPALFAIEYALAMVWKSWGVEPAAVLGHSVGEYAAACVAGVLDLGDALALISTRGRLMQSLPAGGAMAAVFSDEATVTAEVRKQPGTLAIAAVNGPNNIVISGAAAAVDAAVRTFERQGLTWSPLVVSHAFHSPLMDPILEAFEREAGTMRFRDADRVLISNLTGSPAAEGQVRHPDYWRRQIREPVRFADGMRALAGEGCDVFIEIGPSPVLIGMGKRCVPAAGATWLPSLRRGADDWQQMLDSAAELYARGAAIDWDGVERDLPRRAVPLPTYPFERQRHWVNAVHRPDRLPASGVADHPLLQRRLSSPAIRDVIFEATISASTSGFLQDHRVHDRVVAPGTLYLDLALAAGAKASGPGATLEQVQLSEPLVLDDAARRIQVMLRRDDSGASTFEIASCIEGDDHWTTHASGHLVAGPRAGARFETPESLDAIRTRLQRDEAAVPVAALYERLRARGLAYGPAFTWLTSAWAGDDEALGLIEDQRERLGASPAHVCHPGQLDSCLHAVAAMRSLRDTADASAFVPVAFERVVLDVAGAPRLWCHVCREDSPDPASLRLRVHLFDDDGRSRGRIEGLLLRRIDASFLSSAGSRSLNRHVYRQAWRHAGETDRQMEGGARDDRPAARRGTWLIVEDGQGLGSRLALRLERDGQTCRLIARESLAALDDRDAPDVCDVVDLVCLDAAQETPAQARICGSAFATVQALARWRLARAPRLWFVSRRAQAADVETAVWPEEATLAGVARVVANEHPEWRCTMVDIDSTGLDEQADALFALLWSDPPLTEVALRSGARYVPHLIRHVPADPVAAMPLRLERPASGVLSELQLRPAARIAPGPGQIEVRVRAAGMNFRDVLVALGQYPGDVPALGGEFSGVIVAVGPGVTAFTPGDAVAGIAPGSFGTYATTAASLVAPKPSNLTFEQAAAIPIVFLTAQYVLHHVARIASGSRVLIHAAAGGVGHAVIQLARLAGAEIFATAGSPAKRAYVSSLGVPHVMNSRTTDFHDEVLARTSGEGVDVVVNSLIGAFIPKSLALLRRGGTFLEIGKLETWSLEQVAAVNPDATYRVFALEEELQSQAALSGRMLRAIFSDLETGRLTPLPVRAFPIDDAPNAFRYMAQARHVGKIVLTCPTSEYPSVAPDGTILVTGGTGAIGLHLTRWLVQKGARRVLLVSRREPDALVRERLQALSGHGTEIVLRCVDVSDQAALQRLFADLDGEGRPVRGVFHAAGVLDDAPVTQQTWSRVRDVLAPKVDGAWNLHVLTRDRVLDYFVLFSAGATLLGSMGQSSYAAANAFLDALAHARRARGLPALSVNWGPWRDTGMAASRDGTAADRWKAYGIETIDPDDALEVLGRLMNEPAPHAAVMPVRWPDLARHYHAGAVPTLLADLLRQAEGSASRPVRDIRAELARAYPSERRDLAVSFVHDEVARVLGLGPAQRLNVHQALTELGLDSLMVVELRNALSASTGRNLPAGVMFQYPTIDAVAGYVCGLMADVETAAPDAEPAGDRVREIETLSEHEVDDRLNRLLDEHGMGE